MSDKWLGMFSPLRDHSLFLRMAFLMLAIGFEPTSGLSPVGQFG
jgi:hypothetical protein